jgi:cytochrome oxidase Cu insertion factor (SCO1/SenC/PrrC family)
MDGFGKRLLMLCILGLLFSVGHGTGVQVAAALEVGDKAPDFTLPSTTGEKISLSQFRGKKVVLLEFYGADYSPV